MFIQINEKIENPQNPWMGQGGFTLVEVLVVIIVIGILTTMAYLGSNFVYSHRLNAASRGFYSDLQAMRIDALTRASDNASHGFGIRFLSTSQYKLFEFIETEPPSTTPFSWDVVGEEVEVSTKSLPDGVTVNQNFSDDPAGTDNIRIYDKNGRVRNRNWSQIGITYVFHHPKVNDARCVVIAPARIREGIWDVSTTTCRIF
jgi:prepilin-type N-terminal cleavage/methylation domain-containing protein